MMAHLFSNDSIFGGSWKLTCALYGCEGVYDACRSSLVFVSRDFIVRDVCVREYERFAVASSRIECLEFVRELEQLWLLLVIVESMAVGAREAH